MSFAGNLIICAALTAICGLMLTCIIVIDWRVLKGMRPVWRIESTLLVFFFLGLFKIGAVKPNVNGCMAVVSPSGSPALAARAPISVDNIGYSMPENFPSVTNLCLWGIAKGTNCVELGIAWPPEMTFTNGCVDIFGNWRLDRGGWSRIAVVDVSSAATNAIAEIPKEDYPTNAMEQAAFFQVLTQTDTDGDGLSDGYENLVSMTNPQMADTDGDGLFDGDELSGTVSDSWGRVTSDPLNADTDTDGLSDGMEAQYGTNPQIGDSDGDGMSDGNEVSAGGDPLGEDGLEDLGPVVTTAAPGPDFEIVGEHAVTVSFQEPYTDDFSILGLGGPGGNLNVRGITFDVSGPPWTNAFTLTASGASFKPLKTGYYAFQADADDSATVHVGDLAVYSSWPSATPGPVTQMLMIAEREYPVRAEVSSIGGPAKLTFPKWGEFTPIEKPRLSVKFSRDAVLFEEAYGDDEVIRLQTKTMLKIAVCGGGLGGTLTIEQNGMNKIALLEGNVAPESVSIGANGTNTWMGIYGGSAASTSIDDISLVAKFVENDTGSTLVQTAKLTCVEIDLQPRVTAPENLNPHRHEVGVAEVVRCMCHPGLSEVSWEFVGGGNDQYDENGYFQQLYSGGILYCPLYDNDAKLNISYKGVNYTPALKFIEPQGIEARNVVVPSYNKGVAVNVDGEIGAVLQMDLYLLPMTVSFEKLAIEEVPCTNSAYSGGFSNFPANRLSHTREAGAGRWRTVSNDNGFGTDVAGFSNYPESFGPGEMIWEIPVAWNRRGTIDGEDPYREFARGRYQQVMTVYTNNSSAVEKYGYRFARNRTGPMESPEQTDE